MIRRLEDGIVQPVCTRHTPRLGPLAIIAATDEDFHILRQNLGLPDSRKLFLSGLCLDAADSGSPVLVGPLMGAPYAVMVLETLRAWGVQTLFFLGWCGSISSDLRSGDILLPDSAIIDEGTSLHYEQYSGDIVRPSAGLCDTLIKTLQQSKLAHRKGRVWSTDAIFRETPSKIKKFQKQGALAVEMELSALCSAARFYGLSFAALLIVSDELFTLQWRPGFKDKVFKQSRTAVCSLLSEIHRSLDHDGYQRAGRTA